MRNRSSSAGAKERNPIRSAAITYDARLRPTPSTRLRLPCPPVLPRSVSIAASMASRTSARASSSSIREATSAKAIVRSPWSLSWLLTSIGGPGPSAARVSSRCHAAPPIGSAAISSGESHRPPALMATPGSGVGGGDATGDAPGLSSGRAAHGGRLRPIARTAATATTAAPPLPARRVARPEETRSAAVSSACTTTHYPLPSGSEGELQFGASGHIRFLGCEDDGIVRCRPQDEGDRPVVDVRCGDIVGEISTNDRRSAAA